MQNGRTLAPAKRSNRQHLSTDPIEASKIRFYVERGAPAALPPHLIFFLTIRRKSTPYYVSYLTSIIPS
jgi:hypothetical protein